MNVWDQNALIIFILFVIPGFISIKTYELIYPGETFDTSKKIIDAVAFSCINYAFLAIPVYFLIPEIQNDFLIIIFGIFALFVFPVIIVYIFSLIRKSKLVQRKLPHPVGKPWDYVFSQQEIYWMVVTLNDGTKLGGKFAEKSFISSSPHSNQIYLEESWEMNDDGMFERKHNNTKGVLIVTSEIKLIEFFEYDPPIKNDNKDENAR